MHRIFSFFFILPILFCFHSISMVNLVSEAEMITFYKEGIEIELSKEEIETIDNLFSETIKDSISMPAYGVSIDSLTKEEMKKGLWIELTYHKTFEINGMPFDSLLFKVEQNCYGINLIRGQQGIYEGRCFYLDFGENTFDKLYDYLMSINFEEQEIELDKEEEKEIETVEENIEEDKKEKLLKSQKTILEKLN